MSSLGYGGTSSMPRRVYPVGILIRFHRAVGGVVLNLFQRYYMEKKMKRAEGDIQNGSCVEGKFRAIGGWLKKR